MNTTNIDLLSLVQNIRINECELYVTHFHITIILKVFYLYKYDIIWYGKYITYIIENIVENIFWLFSLITYKLKTVFLFLLALLLCISIIKYSRGTFFFNFFFILYYAHADYLYIKTTRGSFRFQFFYSTDNVIVGIYSLLYILILAMVIFFYIRSIYKILVNIQAKNISDLICAEHYTHYYNL